MSQHDDADLDHYLRGNSRLSKLYKGARDGGPSAELDHKILARAHEALANDSAEMKRKPRPGWLIPLSVAATVLLGVNLAFNLKDFTQDNIYTRSNGFIVGDEESTGVTADARTKDVSAPSESTAVSNRRHPAVSPAQEGAVEAEPELERLRSLKQVQDEQRRRERGIVDITTSRALRRNAGQVAPAAEAAVPPADSAGGMDKNSRAGFAAPPSSTGDSERDDAQLNFPSPVPEAGQQQPQPAAESASVVVDDNAKRFVPPPSSADATEREVARYSVPSPLPEDHQQPSTTQAAALEFEEPPTSDSPEDASGRTRTEPDGIAHPPDGLALRKIDEDHADLADVARTDDTYTETSIEELQIRGNTSATRKMVDSANSRLVQTAAYRCDLDAMGIAPEAIVQARQAAVNAVPALAGTRWVQQIRGLSDAQSYKDACISLAAYIEVFGQSAVPDDLPLTLSD